MSPEQESIWLNDQLGNGTSAYVENWTHHLEGPVDPAAVTHALTTIVARHEALRTRLALVDGVPTQLVEPAAPVPLHQRDIHPDQLDEALRAAVRGPLPLDEPPLLRASLLRTGPDDQVLAVTLHHAVIDGWSLRILEEEFSELYRAAVAGTEPQLPSLPLQFGDYAHNQRQRPEARLDPLLTHWRSVLDGAPDESSFPSRRVRPAVASHRGGQVRFRIDAETVRELRTLARALRCTPFVLLAAALSALVARLSGQRDVVLGTPMSRRGEPELEPLIGCLTDLLPLRARTEGTTFADLARAMKSAVWDAVAHRDVSYGHLVRALEGSRTLARFALFQVVLTVDDADAPGLDLSGVRARRLHPHGGTAKFDAFFHLMPADGGYDGLLEYASDLFDHADAERLAGRFTTLLDAAVRRPELPLDQLELLPSAERAELARWAVGAPGRAAPPLVHEAFRATAARTPDADAVLYEGRPLSYRALDAASDALAHRLAARGHAGGRIAFCLPRGPGLPVAVLAVLKAGGTCIPVDPAYPAARRALLLRDSEARALLTSRTRQGSSGTTAPDIDLLYVEDDMDDTDDRHAQEAPAPPIP
ncbi:condensation domain-containing protein, partial [Streptomyces boluensis]